MMEHKTTNGFVFKFSPRDLPIVRSHRWWADPRPNGVTYVTTFAGGRKLYLHRLILRLAAMPYLVCDHRDGDGLNNCRSNLRAVTQRCNLLNRRRPLKRTLSSRFRGVTRVLRTGRWQAQFTAFGRNYYLGTFDREEDAAKAYDGAAATYIGRDARLNFSRC